MAEQRTGDWMITHSGLPVWPLDPRVEDVRLSDIAAALSKQCRFAGHCRRFYSVAEHSVLVSRVVPHEHALQALLHDATEAYCVDVPRPLKRALGVVYAGIETMHWRVIARRFGVPIEMHPCVKEADDSVLLAERDQLFPSGGTKWNVPGTPAQVVVRCYAPPQAEYLFLRRFDELTEGHGVAP